VETPRNIVGPVVRELREKQGLTQAQLVAKLNLAGWDVSRDMVARIEGQIRWAADFEIVKLAEGLGLDAAGLIRQAVAKGQKRPQSLPFLLRKAPKRAIGSPFPARGENRQPLARLKLRPQVLVGKPLWQQIPRTNPENLRKEEQFAIRHPAELRLQLAHRTKADVPTQQLQLLRELALRPAFLNPELLDLGAYHV
jgi:transcriptional regulator with XRE-family HTH domain